MNKAYDTYIEEITAFIGEYCDRETIQRDEYCSGVPLLKTVTYDNDNWLRLDDIFFDKMKEAIEETIAQIVWNVLDESTAQLRGELLDEEVVN